MFNENWVALAVFAALIGLLFQQSGLLAIAILVLVAALAGKAWNTYSLQGIEYERAFSERRAFLGETVDLTLQVTNRKLLPISWLKVDDEYPLQVTMVEGEAQPSTKPEVGLLSNVMSLRWFERVKWRYRLRCDKRGVYAFGPVHLQSGDLFGLFSSQQERPKLDWLIVYPEVKPIAFLPLPPKEPFGEVKTRQWIFEDPCRAVGIRDYETKDDLKRIHWKATARQQKLQVKVYEPTTTYQLVIFLNMATLPKPWHGTIPELLERAISVAASIANYAVQRRFQVGVLANGCWPYSDQALKVLPSRSPDQLTRILEALAAVSAMPTISIEALLNKESARLPWGATLLVVTAVITEELLAVMTRLQTAGRRMVLVRLDDNPLPCEAPNFLVQHVVDLGNAFGLETEVLP
ncbi:MAG: DUF58 domain-containing protein [Chloroflexi bacterium]|nr:DUF58 domain-containing protein [Chloroflexota bacterium]